MKGKPGRPCVLEPWEQSWVARAVKLRNKLTDKAMAARFGVSLGALRNHVRKAHGDRRPKR